MLLYVLAVVAVAAITVVVVVLRGLRQEEVLHEQADVDLARREHDVGQRLPPPGDHHVDLPELHPEGEDWPSHDT